MMRATIGAALALCVGCTGTTRYRVNEATGRRVEDSSCTSLRTHRETEPELASAELPDDPATRRAWRAARVPGAASRPERGFLNAGEHCEQESSIRVGSTVALIFLGAFAAAAAVSVQDFSGDPGSARER